MSATISAVIVTYNSAGCIRRCLDRFEAVTRRRRHEVLVVDNASSDGTVAIVSASIRGCG